MIELCWEYLSVRCIWLHVLMSRTRFRVNPRSSCSHLNLDFTPALSKEFLDIQAIIESGFTLKCVRDMIRTYNQMQSRDKYSQHSSTVNPLWLSSWVFVYELSSYAFESSWSQLNLRFRACIKQGVLWHSCNYRVWIHAEMRTWLHKNIQSNAPYR